MPSGRLSKLGVVLDTALQRLEANCTSVDSVQATTAIIQARRVNKYATDSRLQNCLKQRTIGIKKKIPHEQVQKNKSSCFLPAFIKHEAKALNVIQNIVHTTSTHEVKRSGKKPVKYDCYSCNLQAMTSYFPDRWEKTASLTSGL